jgi:light-regulated signal transduction histidine kinase (bacteriophytochrome)
VKVDPGSMSTVFRALLDNALKFHGPAATVIRIQALESDDHCTVSVSDNGIGIERAFFDRIFVVFQRLHGRGEYSGNGIGLALCKKIVERHGGTIWVESEIGAGATFHFRLPMPRI